jgi:hypothetical protein
LYERFASVKTVVCWAGSRMDATKKQHSEMPIRRFMLSWIFI